MKRIILFLGTLQFVFGASVYATEGAGVAEPCNRLEQENFSEVVDAPTQVIAATSKEATDGLPAYCHVQGYVSPNVGFEMVLPQAGWNGKYFQAGCGGFCGGINIEYACLKALQKGYACLTQDMGHKSTGTDGKWAYNNLQAKIDYGYRSDHVTALAGKAIAERFYAKKPAKSYFMGCSSGGRQGMLLAQRFPWDFDGIVAGAPALSLSDIFINMAWNVRASEDLAGNSMLSPEQVRSVHAAAVARCDKSDGVEDGVIGDPRTCKVETTQLLCGKSNKEGCLSETQAAAVEKIYRGPVTSSRTPITYGGAMPGSEEEWITTHLHSPGQQSTTDRFLDYFRYLGFWPNPGPEWSVSDFDFDRDYKRMGMMESLTSATDPDLREFKAAGGKLISYHGWGDFLISPMNTVDYYETAEKTLGGREATKSFYRLFMVPGMLHCSGGEGPYAVDWLGALEAWTEKGQPPDVLIGAHPKEGPTAENWVRWYKNLQFPMNPADVAFTRPLYPYPVYARYKGKGDSRNASSFEAAGR